MTKTRRWLKAALAATETPTPAALDPRQTPPARRAAQPAWPPAATAPKSGARAAR